MDKHLGETGKGDGRVKMFLRTYLPLCVFFNSNKHLGGTATHKKKMTNRGIANESVEDTIASSIVAAADSAANEILWVGARGSKKPAGTLFFWRGFLFAVGCHEKARKEYRLSA